MKPRGPQRSRQPWPRPVASGHAHPRRDEQLQGQQRGVTTRAERERQDDRERLPTSVRLRARWPGTSLRYQGALVRPGDGDVGQSP